MEVVMRRYKADENKGILGYRQYDQLVEESNTMYKLDNKKKVIKDTLKRLEKEAGELSFYGIAQYLLNQNGGHVTKDMVIEHIKGIILELIKKEGNVMATLNKTGDSLESKTVVQGIMELMASLTVDEVVHEISKKQKEQEVEDGETE
jgi:hypothetical protein